MASMFLKLRGELACVTGTREVIERPLGGCMSF